MHHQDQLTEIGLIVSRIKDVQDTRKLSDQRLLQEFPQLGSTRTWRQRLLAGNLKELRLDKQLKNLRDIAAILDGGVPDEVFFPALQFAVEMHSRLERLERQTNDRRILVCLAPNGTGKSAFARWAVAQSRSSRCVVRCRPTWRNKSLHLCLGLARALGLELNTTNPSIAEDEVIKALRTPRTVFIDQAHEGGVAVMHLLRALIDETPSRFVYLAYNTAYCRVQTSTADAMIEARAFVGRCMKPIFDLYNEGTRPKDVKLYLQEVAGFGAGSAESLAARVVRTLNAHTNLRLLDDAIAAAMARSDGDCPEPDLIVNEVNRLAGEAQAAAKEAE